MSVISFVGTCSCGRDSELIHFQIKPSHLATIQAARRAVDRSIREKPFHCPSCGQVIERYKMVNKEQAAAF